MKTVYLKQAWRFLRTERLYSSLYIGGVALSIAAVMVLSTVLYTLLAPVYPELKRPELHYINSMRVEYKKGMSSGPVSAWTGDNWVAPMKTVEAYTVISDRVETLPVSVQDGGVIDADTRECDPQFWKIYDFDFIEGAPFTQAQYDEARPVVVISDDFARKIFGSANGVVGRNLSVNYIDVTVAGVVKEAASSFRSYAQVYIPRSISGSESGLVDNERVMMGSYQVVLLPKQGVTREEMVQEFRSQTIPFENKYADQDLHVYTYDQPRTHYDVTFIGYMWRESEETDYIGHYLFMILLMLMVPALNLSGMIVGRVDRRLGEMGIRKAFGARRSVLLSQIIWENLLLTTIGAICGLIVSWLLCWFFGSTFLTILSSSETNGDFSLAGMFSPELFLIAFAVSLVLNVISSYVPAWLSLRKSIVSSLNEKK